ncbi:DUF29 domain-containing protein [Floridanema evergladense]|uniref:DUF29 domain-containing protein n=1 Tax=Floridaenema evergladense BLCC-F167 TaxID=3153639 RepID=A0ABV4WPQ4_9CYAN
MSVIDLKTLYETDDLEWLSATIELLKNRQFNALDVENLIEELEYLGRSEKSKVFSKLRNIVAHLLLLQYWESEREYNANGWREEIYNWRDELDRELTTNLRNYLEENLDLVYERAFRSVKKKTGSSVNFPEMRPSDYTLENLLDFDWE